jgi:hypothetical protein
LLHQLLLSTAYVSKGIDDVKDKAGLGVGHPSGGETVSSFRQVGDSSIDSSKGGRLSYGHNKAK